MSRSPFFPSLESLPQTLPIFPLAGAVVMPGSDLPLNIFEPRYLRMVADALAAQHLIGMVQPDPRHSDDDAEPVYRSGCAGRITAYQETADGRITLVLSGVCRFDILSEALDEGGYRVAQVDWERFTRDMADESTVLEADRDELDMALREYFRGRKLDTNWAVLVKLGMLELVHLLTTLLPLQPAEKQAVVEAVQPLARFEALMGALRFPTQGPGDGYRH